MTPKESLVMALQVMMGHHTIAECFVPAGLTYLDFVVWRPVALQCFQEKERVLFEVVYFPTKSLFFKFCVIGGLCFLMEPNA